MKIQIIQDDKGKPAGVFIPIEQWNKLRKKYSELDDLELKHSNTEQILEEFKEAMMELRSEEHTSELQSRGHLVCRLLLEKKKYLKWQCRAGGPGRHDLGLVESLEGGLGCRLSNLPHWIRVV